jgi:hypothetical protein
MLYQGRRRLGQSFSLVRQAFLQADGLPFGDLLSEDDIQQAFETEHACFARDEGDIYTPAITLWAFLSQALHAQRLRSCAAAVSRVIVLCVALGRRPPSPDTGAYCRARAKLPEAVLRRLLDRFQPGDVFLGDCCFCSYFLLALLLAEQVDVVVRQHQRRTTDFRFGQRLGKEDHVVQWQRPQRPSWMDQETYATIPQTLEVRELKVRVAIRGFRVQQLVVVTTLTDAKRYPPSEVAGLFRVIAWHQVGHRPDRVEPRAIKRHPKPHRWLRQPRAEARAALCGGPPAQ